jgi:hypothetical protein
VSNPTFRLDTRDLKFALNVLKDRFPAGLRRAVLRAANSGRVEMARAIAQDTGLGVRRVRDEIGVQRVDEFGAEISVEGARLPLIDFRARGPEPSRGRGRGVAYRLPGGRATAPRAFIATMRNGHRGVFQREEGAARLPIAELHGPSLAEVFSKLVPIAQERAHAALRTNLMHEISYALRR